MIHSMTGYARTQGASGSTQWSWDIKTVNAKGLDLRLRLPPGFDALEIEGRRKIGTRLARGTCQATLSLSRGDAAANVRIDTELLTALLETLSRVAVPLSIGPATLDGLLTIRGVVETGEKAPDEAETRALRVSCEAGLEAALDALVAMRATEGEALRLILDERLATIGRLTERADAAPERRPEAVRDKLERAIAGLADRHALDPDRLHQEVVLIAAKADVREELDRLATHVAASRTLLASGGPVGRKLDFLAQELGREASTYCAKANDAALTAIGLELRVEIEQFREQVQNIE